jgi:hypothetical protein
VINLVPIFAIDMITVNIYVLILYLPVFIIRGFKLRKERKIIMGWIKKLEEGR